MGTDATDLDIYRSSRPLQTHLLQSPIWKTSDTKTKPKMSPNMACEALQSFSPRLTVAKRKEALELRKVSDNSFLTHYIQFFCMARGVKNEEWILNIAVLFFRQ